jgi:acetylglutamate kinase
VLVLKIGGNELDSAPFLGELGALVKAMPQPPVIVHGGGKATTELGRRLGIEPRFVDGLRVTDDAVLEAAVMGLVGTASASLVQALSAHDVPALGLSGLDAGLVRAEVFDPALGHVGRPAHVRADRLRALLDAGFVPCLAPICVSEQGALLNVNADHVAQAVAQALQAEALIFVTNVPGVLRDGQTVAHLEPAEVDALIASGVLQGGMVPKTRAACAAVTGGVRRVLIADVAGVARWLDGERAGTEITAKGARA